MVCALGFALQNLHQVQSRLWTAGLIIHQTYNQLLPNVEAALAERASDKALLGYHDIRLGNAADPRMIRFIGQNLPAVAAEARAKYDVFKDLLDSFARGVMPYDEFAGRVRRRSRGEPENFD